MKKANLLLLILLAFACEKPQPYTDLNGNGEMEPYENPSLAVDERVDDLFGRMSDDDKINLVVGIGFNMPPMFEAIQTLRVPGAVGSTYTFDSLGINGMIVTDGPAGVRIHPIEDSVSNRTYYCTAFPIASLVASTWDTDLAYQVGKAMGHEVKEYGMDVLLGPAQNIHRNPLAGRNFEYFSEDPLLSGKISAAVINGVQSNGVGTSVKHFAVNNQETNRTTVDVIVSERALREIYLRGFEIAVKESNPWTIMSSYNQINGETASQNSDLLEKVLRGEWGFEGFVMTDWFAGTDAVAQINAGNDLLMPGTPEQRATLKAGLENGTLEKEALDRNAKRILKVLLASPSFNGYEYSDNPDLDGNAKLARMVAAEGVVLLKNEDALPLSSGDLKVATFGNGSYDFIAGGTGSGDVNEAYTISLVQGLENAGLTVNAELKKSYEAFIEVEKAKAPKPEFFFEIPAAIPERPLSASELKEAVETTDIALITIGRVSGEFFDRKEGGDFYLTDAEKEMIESVSNAFHSAGKKVVLILNIGNVVETASWKDMVDAIVLPWQGGQEAGNAVVDVLTGAVNPSGKLPTSFPIVYEDVSSAGNFPGIETGEVVMNGMFPAAPAEVTYAEGIYVGYRYFTTFEKEVVFPFGFGLSYTSFDYSDLSVTNDNGNLNVSVVVKNAGTKPGKEAVQVYVSAPGTRLDQPEMELRSFGKTKELAPGESQKLSFSISPKDYASFDSERSSWIVEEGEFELRVGASSEDVKQQTQFAIAGEIIVEELSDALKPQRSIGELTSK